MDPLKYNLLWYLLCVLWYLPRVLCDHRHTRHADCPQATPTSCTWKMGAFDSTYYDGMMYYMKLTIENLRTKDTAGLPIMKKDTRLIGKGDNSYNIS